MPQLPNRLTALVKQVENGEPITAGDLDKASTLMGLDMAVYGRETVEEAIQRTRDADARTSLQAIGRAADLAQTPRGV